MADLVPADLPVHAVLPQLLAALQAQSSAVLIAPPGAGKTTAVAPALLAEPWCTGQIVLTSPRRVAARAAAERMAALLGERAGDTIGYLTRLDSRTSARTRTLVVTEAILVNRIVDDPELSGVSALLFDEAHERHLDGDLGLALALETQAILRPDLRLLVMSATIDGARFARLLGDETPVIESAGRAHPLGIAWLGDATGQPIEDAMTAAVMTAWREHASGDLLAFLPGVREIERVRERLAARLPDTPILPLHGQIDPAGQRAAIARDAQGQRRIVLATAIAETSLTLDGVSVVIDSGLSRRAEYDRSAGTTHLVTRRASQAAAAQRAGRAARQGPGTAYRLWEAAGHAGRPAFDPPEITTADLAPLVLTAAKWGSNDPASLPWLDPPPAASVTAARSELAALGALDATGRITARGQALAALPLAPSLAAMVLFGAEHGAGESAARLALLLQERGLGGPGEDLDARLARWNTDRSARAEASRKLAASWARAAGGGRGGVVPFGVLLAAGRPDFVARRRDQSGETWLAAGGRGFSLDPVSPLARAEFLAIGDAQGQAKGARITAAAPLTLAELESWFGDRIAVRTRLDWTGKRVEARRERRLGAIVLSSGPEPAPDRKAVSALLLEKACGAVEAIVPPDLVARGRFAGIAGLSLDVLRGTASDWLAPLLSDRSDFAVHPDPVAQAVLATLDWGQRQQLDLRAPRRFLSPAGTSHSIDYTGDDAPCVEVRVQAMFGLDVHPMAGSVPLLVKLTSPAGRPVQATRDLAGFWRGSWKEVQREMKGRYPRHRWPDQPWTETPSLKTKNAFHRSPG